MYFALLLVVSLLSLGVQVAVDPSGRWEGKIQIPEREVSVTVDLAKTAAGSWIGSLSIPVSTSIDVPLGNISIDGTIVTFTAMLPGKATFEGKGTGGSRAAPTESRAVSGSFTGTLGDTAAIAGEWTQGPTRLPLTFHKVDAKK